MKVEIINSGLALSKSMINEFEKINNTSIPPEYFSFLLENNGGRPKPSDFLMHNKMTQEHEWIRVSRFLGIGDFQTDSLDYVLRIFKNRLPVDVFPIARDPGGNLICLSTGTNNYGYVLFWDHEFESDNDENPTYDNIYFIAKNLKEFLDNLTE